MRPSGADRGQPAIVAVEKVTAGGLNRLRQLVSGAARDAGFGAERVARFTLAVNELATNAIQHGDGTAEVTVRAAQGHVIVDVEDRGPGIPLGRLADRPEPEAMRGRGLWLAREFSDRLDIFTDSTGTRVRVKIAAPPA